MKNAPSALLNYISTREFLRTRAREALEKHEPQASASRTSRVFLKIRTWLYYSKMYEENVFCFFYKIVTQKQIPLLNCSETIKLQIKRRHFIYIYFNFLLIDKTRSFFFFYNFNSFMNWKDKMRPKNSISSPTTYVNIDFHLSRTNSLIGSNLESKWNAFRLANYFYPA